MIDKLKMLEIKMRLKNICVKINVELRNFKLILKN